MADVGRGFEHGANFAPGEVSGGFGLGPLELQYEGLFAEALADGVITAEERAQLDRAADDLGLDRQRLLRLERAMVAAYKLHHRRDVVEHEQAPVASLAPFGVAAGAEPSTARLLERVSQLEARIAELEAELERAQTQVNVEVDLSGLGEGEEPDEGAEAAWRRVRRDARNVEAARALYRAVAATSDVDRQWCVAQLLVTLGAATPEQEQLYQRHRVQGLIAPRAGVSPTAWYDLLFHPDDEVLTGQIFAVIAPAVLLGRVAALRRDRQLYVPEPSKLQDPSQATVTAVRALAWASALLGLATPKIYLEKERPGGFEHAAAVPPVTLVGRQVLSGRSQQELAFLAGRHLAAYRQEHYVRTLFSGVEDLEGLFLAALTIGNRGLPMTEEVRRRVGPVAEAIEPVLQPQQIDALRGYFLRFVEEGGRTNLQRWSAGVDKTAARAGFVLSNDLGAALGMLEAEGAHADVSQDLRAYAVSESYGKLRRQLGIQLTG